MNHTYSAKPKDVKRSWYLLDAKDDTLGRLASIAATLLLGKNKPQFTSHIDCGDYVVIVNAGSIKVTGNKLTDKKYYRHSHYPGGLHQRSLKEQLEIDPTKVFSDAVCGMLPKNKLLDDRMKRLKIYAGSEHSHQAQNPQTLNVKKGDLS